MMMNYEFKMMNYAFKMMNFVFKMMKCDTIQVGSRNDMTDASKGTRLLSQDTPLHKGGGTNPVWDCALDFELRDEDTHLKLSCWDKEVIGKDNLIGHRSIDLSNIGDDCKDMREEHRVHEALDIFGDDDRKSHGTMHIAIQWSPSDRKAKAQMTHHVETLGIMEEEQDVLRRAKDHFFTTARGTQSGLRRSIAGGGRSGSPARTPGGRAKVAPRARRPALTKPKEYEYEVRVHVHQARDLPVKDTDTHSSDPYLKATIAGQEQRTATKPQNLNPQWYETLQFRVMLPQRERIERGLAPQMLIQLFDQDMDADDFIGRLTVDLQDMGGAHMPKRPRWYRIIDNDTGGDLGQVLLAFQLIGPLRSMDAQDIPPMPGDAPYAPQLAPKTRDCTLEFFVLGCRALKPLAFEWPGSPYVEVSFFSTNASGAEKTATSKSNMPLVTNPNFCEVIKKRIAVPEDALYAPVLELAVRDPRFGSLFLARSDALLGTATIPLRKYLPWIPSNYMRAQRQSQEIAAAAKAELAGGSPRKRKSESMIPGRESMDVSEHDAMLDGSVGDSAVYDLESAKPGSVRKGRNAARFAPVSRDSTVVGEGTTAESDSDSDTESVASPTSGGGEDQDDINDTPGWLRNRQRIPDELEDWLFENRQSSSMVYRPFEEWSLARDCKETSSTMVSDANNMPKFGRVKGFVRVVDNSPGGALPVPFPIDVKEFTRPSPFVVRLYVIRAAGLAALDGGNSSDPYLVASLGETTFKCRENVVKATLKPYFGQVFEFETTMPGPTQLKLAVYDW